MDFTILFVCMAWIVITMTVFIRLAKTETRLSGLEAEIKKMKKDE